VQRDRPSWTAEMVAAVRADHRLHDRPVVCDDPFALPLFRSSTTSTRATTSGAAMDCARAMSTASCTCGFRTPDGCEHQRA